MTDITSITKIINKINDSIPLNSKIKQSVLESCYHLDQVKSYILFGTSLNCSIKSIYINDMEMSNNKNIKLIEFQNTNNKWFLFILPFELSSKNYVIIKGVKKSINNFVWSISLKENGNSLFNALKWFSL
jgi:hypothetical protein